MTKCKRPAGKAGESDGLVLGASNNGPQKRKRRATDWTKARTTKFIETLADSCNVSLAARAVQRSINSVYSKRAKDAGFRAQWDQALSIGYSRLEMMMLERALHGTEKVITLKSGEPKIMMEYNDRVALALLRQHRESVAAFEERADEEAYQEACQRIIDRLARLREREAGEPQLETKTRRDRQVLIALALRQRRIAEQAAAR